MHRNKITILRSYGFRPNIDLWKDEENNNVYMIMNYGGRERERELCGRIQVVGE